MSAVDEYVDFSFKVNEMTTAIMFDKEMSVDEYDKNIIWDSIINEEAKIRGFDFEGKASNRISGLITRDDLETTIVYNKAMTQKRINFTISHEIIHFQYHLDEETHFFTDTKDTLSYSDSDILPEFQANIGASILLIPDPVFIYELKKSSSPGFISNKYGISEAALFKRLTQTLQAEFDASYNVACQTTSKIMNSFGREGEKLMCELGQSWERKLLLSNPYYESLII